SRLPVEPPEAAVAAADVGAALEAADALDAADVAPALAGAAEPDVAVGVAELAAGVGDASGTFEMLTGGGPEGLRNRYQSPKPPAATIAASTTIPSQKRGRERRAVRCI